MNSTVLVIVIVVAAVLVVAFAVMRTNRSRDGVDSFRRQIDALSPEARRPVIDQVQNAAGRIEPRPSTDEAVDDAGDSGDGSEAVDDADEGGSDGA